MTELLQNTSYDHIVLLLCLSAVVISGSMMHLSAHLGNLTRGRRLGEAERARGLKLEPTATAEPTARDKAA